MPRRAFLEVIIRRNRNKNLHGSMWSASTGALLCLSLLFGPASNTSAWDPTAMTSSSPLAEIYFEKSTMSATENSTKTLKVNKNGGGFVSVRYKSYGAEGSHTPVSGTLYFDPEDSQKTFTVDILEAQYQDWDDQKEEEQLVAIELEVNPNEAMLVGSPDQAAFAEAGVATIVIEPTSEN